METSTHLPTISGELVALLGVVLWFTYAIFNKLKHPKEAETSETRILENRVTVLEENNRKIERDLISIKQLITSDRETLIEIGIKLGHLTEKMDKLFTVVPKRQQEREA